MKYVHYFRPNRPIIYITKEDYRIEVNCSLIKNKPIVIYRRPVATNELPTIHKTIKGTEYVITGRLSDNARETAEAKMRRIILNAPMEE